MKKLFRWICGILGIIVAIALIGGAIIMIDIHRYGAGRVTFPQVVEVNLRHDLVSVGKDGKGEYFLTDHAWTSDRLLKLGYKETDRMGTEGFYIAPDGTRFSLDDTSDWCPWFRLHHIKGTTLDKLSALSPEARGTHAVSAVSKKQTAQRSLSYFPLPSTTAARYSRSSSYFR